MYFKKQTPSDNTSRKGDKKPTADYKTRRPKQREMIFGLHSVIEAIEAGKTIDKVMVRRDMSSTLARELMAKLEGTATAVQKVPVEKLNQLTDKNHQGVIAFLSPIDFHRLDDFLPTLFESGRMPLLVVLDAVTDVRNFGAIVRTAECAGVDAVVVAARNSVAINGDAVKTSAGALHNMPICKVDNLEKALRYLADSGLRIVAATEHSESDYTDVDYTTPVAILMGSEDVGISPECLRQATDKVRIPMAGRIESLNVSVAAGVMIYEAVRQRRMMNN